jgi:hypothetical protein
VVVEDKGVKALPKENELAGMGLVIRKVKRA